MKPPASAARSSGLGGVNPPASAARPSGLGGVNPPASGPSGLEDVKLSAIAGCSTAAAFSMPSICFKLPIISAISFSSPITSPKSSRLHSLRSAEDWALAAISSFAACWFARLSIITLLLSCRLLLKESRLIMLLCSVSTTPVMLRKAPVTSLIYSACASDACTEFITKAEVWSASFVTPCSKSVILSIDCFVLSASLRISSATTEKPLPASPALAASMDAFNASKFVWDETWYIIWVISSAELIFSCNSCATSVTFWFVTAISSDFSFRCSTSLPPASVAATASLADSNV